MTWTLSHRSRDSRDPFADFFAGWGNLHDRLFPVFPGSTHEEHPALAVFESADGVVVRAEIPGVAPEDIELSVENDTLSLAVDRKAPEGPEGARFHRRERVLGKLGRSVRVPWRIDADQVGASYKQGVLEVSLVRAPEDRPRKIDVKVS